MIENRDSRRAVAAERSQANSALSRINSTSRSSRGFVSATKSRLRPGRIPYLVFLTAVSRTTSTPP